MTTRWLDETEDRAWRGLLVLFNRAMPELERTFREHGLLAIQYGMLVALAEAEGRTKRLSDLADRANMSQSRLTHRMRDLVTSGDVVVTVDPDDHRAKNATLTAQGLRRLKTVAPVHIADVRRLVFDRLDPAQTAALADAMTVLAAGFCDQPPFRTATAE